MYAIPQKRSNDEKTSRPLSAFLFTVAAAQAVEQASEKRLDEVAKRGAQVMPFSLEQATHIFSKTEKGGLQQVIVKDSSNTEQIELIRKHLSGISQEFRQGDFSDPANIHGDNMPGLAELKSAKPGQIKIVYKKRPYGAEIDYSTDDTRLIEAIHAWFDAQLSDHARHAVPGHPHRQIRVRRPLSLQPLLGQNTGWLESAGVATDSHPE